MLNQSTHGSFTIDRTYDAAPARVFAAWASAEAKARWFVGPPESWTLLERSLDFRVGGRELLRGSFGPGRVTVFDAAYHDIVPDRRIVYSYGMEHEGRRISVSLATIEFEPAGRGTRLVLTEQGVFLDGFEDGGGRERGTRAHLERLAAALAAG
jgi:uncharacterized protein YndB with AHSA1/START domain